MRLLLVDDNRLNLELFVDVLEAAGHEVATETDALAGQRRAHGLGREPGGGDAGSHRGAERAGDHHLNGLVLASRVAALPARQLHEPRPEIGPRLVGSVEGKRYMDAEDARQVVSALEMASEKGQ